MGRSKGWSCVQLLLLLLLPLQCFAANAEYYTAGVAEFRPAVSGASSAQLLAENLAAYLELIAAANGSADILVFPEGTLNSQLQLTAVPAPSERSLCQLQAADDDVADFLRRLGCAAAEAHSYLVFNVKERERCDLDRNCPARGYRLYNTNVVLDRSGALVSRYRKWNLYLEPQLNRTSEPEYALFETDFNVTFGHFVCFDMLFYTPAQALVERYKLRNLIVTNMFNSELPFLTASQLQQGWAWANNVNLLAAGASLPHGGISGSGIYAGERGALVRRMVGDALLGERQLLLAHVPRSPHLNSSAVQLDRERPVPEQRQLLMLQQPHLRQFNSCQLPLLDGIVQRRTLCQADLCCEFELSLQLPAGEGAIYEYSYRLGVFVGQRRYEEAQYSVVRLCGLFACRNASVDSCGQLSEASTTAPVQFNALRVTGKFVGRSQRLLMPSTLSASLYALQSTELDWSMQQREGLTHVEVQLKKPHEHLLTFGIYGNYFNEHAAGQGGNNTATNHPSGGAVGLVVLLVISYRVAVDG